MTLTGIMWKFGWVRFQKDKFPPDPLCVYPWHPLCIVYVAGGGKYMHFIPTNRSTQEQIAYVMKLHGFGDDGASVGGIVDLGKDK